VTVTRRQRFVYGHLAWMLGVALALALLDALTYAVFFIVAFVGFLSLLEWTGPVRVAPPWRRRLRLAILLGLAGIGYLVVRRVVALLPPEVL
jgi:hypothetical protein